MILKNQFYIYLVLLLTPIHFFGQLEMANLSMSPLLFHPSMAGAYNRPQIGVSYNQRIKQNQYYLNETYNQNLENTPVKNTQKKYNEYSTTIFYDQLLKKIGAGIGTYLSLKSIPEQFSSNYEYNAKYSSIQLKGSEFGFIFSPKYNYHYDKSDLEKLLTWAPSISIYNQFEKINESFQIPTGNPEDLIPLNYYKKQLFVNQVISIGGMINTPRLIAGINSTYSLAFFRNISEISYPNTINLNEKEYLSRLKISTSFAYSFPKKQTSLLSFTPKILMRFYVNGKQTPFNLMPSDAISHQMSLDFRLWKFIFGSCIGWKNENLNSNYLGFKSSKMKFIVGTRNNTLRTEKVSSTSSKQLITEFSFIYLI